MKFKRLISFFCAAAVVLTAAAAGCGNSDNAFVLEAEKAVAEPVYDGSLAAVCTANSRSENITSNGKYVGKMYAGNTVTWFFTAAAGTSLNICLAVANADDTSEGFTADGSTFEVALNGISVNIPQTAIKAGTQYGDGWQRVDLGRHGVAEGINKIVYTALSDTDRLNIDYLALEGGAGEISEHSHFWKISSTPSTCTEDGYSERTCDDCGFTYRTEIIPSLGHKYGNYHYDGDTMKMVAACELCGDKITANTPQSVYFGEVYAREGGFAVREREVLYEAEDAFVCLAGGLNNPNAVSYIETDNGAMNEPSGGKLVGNISKEGNYIRFMIGSERACKADLVFRMANVLYSSSGIAELSPMSRYVYCTVNGADVDFSFVSFPGYDSHSYYEWRYVVVRDVEFTADINIIEIGPKANSTNRITMPNTDVLKIYTDGDGIHPVKCYTYNDVASGTSYGGGYTHRIAFEGGGETFTVYPGVAAERCDIALHIQSDEAVANLASLMTATYGIGTVNLEGISLAAGESVVTIGGVPLSCPSGTLRLKITGRGIAVTQAFAYTKEALPEALGCGIVPEYDYVGNSGSPDTRAPSLVFEAEEADLGESVSSRAGIDLVELNIYENTGRPASGNSAIGNFAVKGNSIVWRFNASDQVVADIVLMLASANYNSSAGGNVRTDGLQSLISVTVNGVAARLEDIVLDVDSLGNYYDWKAVTLKGCVLNRGLNEVKLTVLSNVAPNMDVLYVYAEGAEFTV